MKYKLTRKSNNYLAPASIIERALQILGLENNKAMAKKFDCDVCCSEEYVPAKTYYKYGEKNGLVERWKPTNWCNPPFDECSKWVKKAYNEQQAGRTSILLLPVRTETAYWHDYILFNDNVRIFWLRKGHKFIDAQTKKEMGVFKGALALVLFRGIKCE